MLYKENLVKSGEVFQTKIFAPPAFFSGYAHGWEDHNLLLNVSKTEELVLDFGIEKDPIVPIQVKIKMEVKLGVINI